MLTNSTNIPLSIAVFLATDTYDYVVDKNYISATSLLKPIKSVILERTLPTTDNVDIAELVPSKVGTSVHDGIEYAWRNNYRKAMKNLGHPDDVINRIILDPTKDELSADSIAIYMERRTLKQVGDWKVGGKFDFVADGILTDYKTTKVYSYISGSNEDNYIKQGSIYRWLNPDIITSDYMNIGYIFTDWNRIKAAQDPRTYPAHPVLEKRYNLMSIDQIEAFIIKQLNTIDTYKDKPQDEMPQCTSKELWQTPTKWAYYKDPTKTSRSTKNFDNSSDAYARLASDGGTGLVTERPGEVRRCNYCNAKDICLQAGSLMAAGLLK